MELTWTDARLERPIHLTTKTGVLVAEIKEVAQTEPRERGATYLWTIHRAERAAKLLQASGRAHSLDGAQAVVAAILAMLTEEP